MLGQHPPHRSFAAVLAESIAPLANEHAEDQTDDSGDDVCHWVRPNVEGNLRVALTVASEKALAGASG